MMMPERRLSTSIFSCLCFKKSFLIIIVIITINFLLSEAMIERNNWALGLDCV